MRTWLNVNGTYINLAVARSIEELDHKSGWIGYTIYHDGFFITIRVPQEIETTSKPDRTSEDYKVYRVIIIIRMFLYDRTLQDTSVGSRREDDY